MQDCLPCRGLKPSFDDDRGVLVYLQKLAKSPLVRRSLPNAAATMSQYFGFRKLPQETIASFLVRETLSYEEFQEALIRLREERSGVDPAQQDFGLGEVFRRSDDEWWNQQQRWRQWERQDGPENDDAPRPSSPGENDDAAPKTFSPSRSAAGSPPPRRGDYEPLPQQSDPGDGMPPVVASAVHSPEAGLTSADSFLLDVLRGWRLLQAASLSKDEWRDILSATGNKLDF